jgi:hypothetical protein
MIQYNPNDLQIRQFIKEMNKIAKDQASIEHEKLRYSMIGKVNDDILHNILEIRSNTSKLLSSQQIEHMQNVISAQSQNLQELYYQNTRNELLQKGIKQHWK